MSKQKHSPKLYKIDSKGKIREWSQSVFFNEHGCKLVTNSGIYEGVITPRTKIIKDSKQKPAFERAVVLMDNSVERKERDGYRRSIEEAQNAELLLRPMLAEKYDDTMIINPWEWFVQPKINGVRCLYDPITDKLYSKTGLEFYVPDIKKSLRELSMMMGGAILDGELYIHGFKVGDILSAVKTLDNPNRPNLVYYLYDIVNSEVEFQHRNAVISKHVKKFPSNILYCPTFRLHAMLAKEQMEDYYKHFLSQGFEGLMLRRATALYQIGRRTIDLLKKKPVYSGEFPVVHITYERRHVQSIGSVCDLVEFHCKSPKGVFKVIPAWTELERFNWRKEDRQKMTVEQLVDTLDPLMVEYRELTANGLPFHAVGIYFRPVGY